MYHKLFILPNTNQVQLAQEFANVIHMLERHFRNRNLDLLILITQSFGKNIHQFTEENTIPERFLECGVKLKCLIRNFLNVPLGYYLVKSKQVFASLFGLISEAIENLKDRI
jgi:hypothetical protein